MAGNTSKRYPAELKQRGRDVWGSALRSRVGLGCDGEGCPAVGITTTGTLRKWVRRAEIDQGERRGITSEESAEVKRLKRENAELRRANAILKAASAFFAELDRPGSNGTSNRPRRTGCGWPTSTYVSTWAGWTYVAS